MTHTLLAMAVLTLVSGTRANASTPLELAEASFQNARMVEVKDLTVAISEGRGYCVEVSAPEVVERASFSLKRIQDPIFGDALHVQSWGGGTVDLIYTTLATGDLTTSKSARTYTLRLGEGLNKIRFWIQRTVTFGKLERYCWVNG